jgi:hypothetical protein
MPLQPHKWGSNIIKKWGASRKFSYTCILGEPRAGGASPQKTGKTRRTRSPPLDIFVKILYKTRGLSKPDRVLRNAIGAKKLWKVLEQEPMKSRTGFSRGLKY